MPLLLDYHKSNDAASGWVACTTDDVLATKPDLWDVLITLPAYPSKDASTKVFPTIKTSSNVSIRATQRDMRRYRILRRSMHGYYRQDRASSRPTQESEHDDAVSTTSSTSSTPSILPDQFEPPSWPQVAYESFIWWASAGEKRIESEEEEREQDASLLADLALSNANGTPRMDVGVMRQKNGIELALVAYFHRLTTVVLSAVAYIVEGEGEGDAEREEEGETWESYRDEEGESEDVALLRQPQREAVDTEPSRESASKVDREEKVVLGSEDLARMGLDVWSASDRAFVEDLVMLYFERGADVRSAQVECCGVKIF